MNTPPLRSNTINNRVNYAIRDSADLMSCLNILCAEFKLKDSARVTIAALYGIRGSRQKFSASFQTIARQIEKIESQQPDSQDPIVFKRSQRIRRRIKAVEIAQSQLGIELIRFYPGGAERLNPTTDNCESGQLKYHSSQFELPIGDMALEAYQRAHADEYYGAHPGKAIDRAARAVAQEILANAKPVSKETKKPTSNKETKKALNKVRNAALNKVSKSAEIFLDAFGNYLFTAQYIGDSSKSVEINKTHIIQKILGGLGLNSLTSESNNNDTYLTEITGGEIVSPDLLEMGIKTDIAINTYTEPETQQIEPITSEIEKTELPIEQAHEMIAAFESVGATGFDTIYVEYFATGGKEDRHYERATLAQAFKASLSSVLTKCEREQWNLITRPRGSSNLLIQLDDIQEQALEKIREQSFLILETSPANYQAWLAFDQADQGEQLRSALITALGADKGATGCVRVAGSLNIKPLYAPNYPRVRVVATNPGLLADLDLLMPLLPQPIEQTESERIPPCDHFSDSSSPTYMPDYDRILNNASITASGHPDVSKADFHFAALALKWRNTPQTVIEELNRVSSKARARRGYAERTVRAAQKRQV